MMLTWIISSSVLLAGFLVLRHILTAAMSRRLQYALWAIVLLRLLLPFSFGETGFSVMNVPPVQMLTALHLLPPPSKKQVPPSRPSQSPHLTR